MLWTNNFGMIFQYIDPNTHGMGDWSFRVGGGKINARPGCFHLPSNWLQAIR